MAKLPAYDARLMHLGEAGDLLAYAKEMSGLLESRWERHRACIGPRCAQAGYSQEDFDCEYQAEEYQHAKYEVYLDGQLVVAAWSVLQGAVEHCASFLAEHLRIEKKLDYSRKPAELAWQHYYEQGIQVGWPLKDDCLEIAALRKLRNDYAHSLFFEPYSVRGRLKKIAPDTAVDRSELFYQVDAFVALKGQGVLACELVARLVEMLKEHAIAQFPHDGVSLSFWARTR